MMVEWLFLAVHCLWVVIVVSPDHTYLLFFMLSLSDNNQADVVE